jgi:hypothetical protein
MKVFLALIVALGLTSCAYTTDHFYAGVALVYQGKDLVDYQLIGVATTKEHCEAGMKLAAKDPSPPGMSVVYGCAEIVPVLTK